jgi:hypothetical protein
MTKIKEANADWVSTKREGVSRAANDKRSEELAEGLGVEWVRWLFRARTNGRPIERSDCIVLEVDAECNEADCAKDGEGGAANLSQGGEANLSSFV